MNSIAEVSTKLDSLIPEVQKNHFGVIEISLNNFVSYENNIDITLSTFDDNLINIIANNLYSGRLPENPSEFLYYNALGLSFYNIGDILNITTEAVYSGSPIITNCQIVGVVNNLESLFYSNNLSTDILREANNYFIAYSNYFYNLVNGLENKHNELNVNIDIEYTFSLKHIRTNRYIKALNDYFWVDDKSFSYLPNPNPLYFCEDLKQALNRFKMDWYLSIYNQLVISSPIILFLAFISVEIYRMDNYDKRAKYRLFKMHGLNDQFLANFLIVENLVLLGSSLVIGLGSSLIIDYFIVGSLDLSPNVLYFAGFSNSTSILLILFLFIVFFITNYTIDYVQLRKTKVTIKEQYRIKKRRFFSKVFSLPEVNFLAPGITLAVIGLPIGYLAYDGGRVDSLLSIKFFIGFSLMALLGILFLLLAAFIFLKRVMLYLWNKLGYVVWLKTKSNLTLALKQLSVYVKEYNNTIMAFFLLGLCLTPGFIIKKSVVTHQSLEANLSVGCSDILVKNWDADSNLESNISRIDGVTIPTVLSHVTLPIDHSNVFSSNYIFNFYVLTNITEFIAAVNFTLLQQDGYSKDDILMLETDLTYLMNRKFVMKNSYDKDNSFTTVGITPSIFEPKELVYINDFSYFPLITRERFQGTFIDDIFNQPIIINLVVSSNTKDLILENNARESYQTDYLLIKVEEGANITAIKAELTTNYYLDAYSLEDFIGAANYSMNSIGLILMIIISILAVILTIIYGYFKAINIFKVRQLLLEVFISKGAKKRFIVGNFTIEFILVLTSPFIISLGIAIPYINNLSSFLLNLSTDYLTYDSWYPCWLLILIGLVGLVSAVLGWSTSLNFLVRNYQLTKSE